MVDALCKSNLVDRGKIEKEILQVTNLEKIIYNIYNNIEK